MKADANISGRIGLMLVGDRCSNNAVVVVFCVILIPFMDPQTSLPARSQGQIRDKWDRRPMSCETGLLTGKGK